MAKSSDLFSFECPRCQTMITVGAETAGQSLQCKNCGANLVVPGAKPTWPQVFDDLFEISEPTNDIQPTGPAQILAENSGAGDAIPIENDSGTASNQRRDSDWELLPDAQEIVEILEPAADPFAHDENAPIRLDEISSDPDLPNQIRVKCPVCDSVMFASSTSVGQKIQCSDCFTMIDVVMPSKPASKGPEKLDRAVAKADKARVSAFPELAPEADEAPIGDDYGLAPASEDMLKPRQESLPQEILDLVQKSYQVPSQEHSQSAVASTSALSQGPATSNSGATAIPQSSRSAIGALPASNATTLPTTEAELPYVPPPPPPLERLTVSQQFKWPEQFLCVFKDLNALQFAGFVAILLAIGYFIADSGLNLYRYTEHEANPYRILGVFVLMIAGGVHFFAMLLAGVMINQTVEGAAHQRSVFHPPELGLIELLSSFAVVGVSFWAGMLPGIIFGQLISGITGSWWLMFAIAFGTAFLLAPIGILGAYYNGSAVQIVSTEVLQSVRHHTAGWIRFYCWMALWIVVFCLAWFFRRIPSSLIGGTLCAVVQAAALLLMGRTIGLLAQAFINFWIDSNKEHA